jgi:hypothetical protein
VPTAIKFKFYRKRQLIEAGELTIVVDNITETAIQEELEKQRFKTLLVCEQEEITPDEWQYVPLIRNSPNGKPTPKQIA